MMEGRHLVGNARAYHSSNCREALRRAPARREAATGAREASPQSRTASTAASTRCCGGASGGGGGDAGPEASDVVDIELGVLTVVTELQVDSSPLEGREPAGEATRLACSVNSPGTRAGAASGNGTEPVSGAVRPPLSTPPTGAWSGGAASDPGNATSRCRKLGGEGKGKDQNWSTEGVKADSPGTRAGAASSNGTAPASRAARPPSGSPPTGARSSRKRGEDAAESDGPPN